MVIEPVRVRGLTLGEGMPKLIVPIVSDSTEAIVRSAEVISEIDIVDLVEWRVDFFDDCANVYEVIETLGEMRRILGDKPILFTFRTRNEGGAQELSLRDYVKLNLAVAESGLADLVDIEIFTADDAASLINSVHRAGALVVASSHDFLSTPSQEEIIRRLRLMQDLGGDILKIAVMPNSVKDVLTLMLATAEMNEKYATRPVLAISMSGKGVITRVAAEVFGSCMSFGTVGKSSAPGQIPVDQLASVLKIVNSVL